MNRRVTFTVSFYLNRIDGRQLKRSQNNKMRNICGNRDTERDMFTILEHVSDAMLVSNVLIMLSGLFDVMSPHRTIESYTIAVLVST